jgi:hypothetical protein
MKDDKDNKKTPKILSFADAAERHGHQIKGQQPTQQHPTTDMVDIRARQNIHRIVDYLDEIDERLDKHADAIRALILALKDLKKE